MGSYWMHYHQTEKQEMKIFLVHWISLSGINLETYARHMDYPFKTTIPVASRVSFRGAQS